MKIPTEEEIIKEVQELKSEMKKHDFQMGIGEIFERMFFNKINKVLRMLRKPIRRVDLDFSKMIRKDKNSASIIRRKTTNRIIRR